LFLGKIGFEKKNSTNNSARRDCEKGREEKKKCVEILKVLKNGL